MSWIDDVVDFGKGAISWLSGGGIGPTLAKTALLSYGLNQITKSITKENTDTNSAIATTPEIDRGVRLQVSPDAKHKIPVVYGTALLGGIITDAALTNSNKTMWYCITLCEKTGSKLSDGLLSEFTFLDVYWNDQRIVFNDDGITAAYTVDRDGNVDYSLANNVKVYCYAGSSSFPVSIDNYTSTLATAYTLMPNWTAAHQMNDLIFALVRVDYNKEKGVTQLGDLKFHLQNDMYLPGDCLLDYMTNTRYGAGIPLAEINTQ